MKTDDKNVAKELGIHTFPALVYYRRRNPVLYDGEDIIFPPQLQSHMCSAMVVMNFRRFTGLQYTHESILSSRSMSDGVFIRYLSLLGFSDCTVIKSNNALKIFLPYCN